LDGGLKIRWQTAEMKLAAQRCADAAKAGGGRSKKSKNRYGDDIISKLAGNRSQRIVWDRLTEVVSKPQIRFPA
jgi:hypothetical protein